jgi:hypothetical protein
MAESIDLTGGDEAQPESQMNTPPPAELPAGINPTNPDGSEARVPLPVGRAVSAVDASKLTAREKRDLEKAGWREGEPIPENMAAAIAAAEAAMAEGAGEARLPVAPDTPPVELDPVAIEDLPPEKREQYQDLVASSLAQQAEPSPVMPAMATTPQHIAAARQIPKPAAAEPQAASEPAPASAESLNPHDEPDTPPEPQQSVLGASSGAGMALTHCPHCEWDLSVPALEEPSYEEKMRFLHCVMNGQQFTKEYELMGGALVIGFRTLTTKEMDASWNQVYVERERGDVRNDLEMMERINRCRMYLQLTGVRTDERKRSLPNGLSVQTNVHADAYWKLPEGHKEPLVLIENYMLKEVLPTETIIRLAQFNCQQFNRLVARLEALTDSPDFWKKTEEQH